MEKAPLLLQNAFIHDGSGNAPKAGAILIHDGRIVDCGAISERSVPSEVRRLDLGGLAVSPGFINIHSHSDTDVLVHPEAKTLLLQGITTEVVGNCGGSAVDTTDWDEDRWERILPKLNPPRKWNGVSEYLDMVDAVVPAVNVASLFGHGDIRRLVMGDDGRGMLPYQRAQAAEIAEGWMAEGAFGVSSGLEYVPGRCADVEELIAVSRPVAAAGGFHASHIRNEGPELLESIEETIAVARGSGVRFEVSHIKACGPSNWGKVAKALALLDHSGCSMAADFYPYLASSTELAIVLPDWVVENGKQGGLRLLQDPSTRDRAERESHERTIRQGGWDRVMLTRLEKPQNKWMEGMHVAAVAGRLGKEPATFAIDLLIGEEMKIGIARHAIGEDDLIAAIRHPKTCVITDGYNTVPEESKPHPRSVGTFPRFLGHYAREKGIISMEEGIRKCTSLPARKMGIPDRGLISPGFRADLVIFDQDHIIDRATYENPWQYPEGVFGVMVNGTFALWEGELTGVRSGVGLRHVACSHSGNVKPF